MTFGQVVRAHRLRWGILPGKGQGLMRVSIGPYGGYICELRPLDAVPTEYRVRGEYVLWWDEKDRGKGLVESSPFLRSLTKINKPFTVVLNEAGEVMR